MVHEDYEPDIPGKTNHESYNDIALIKFDRPFYWEFLKKSTNKDIKKIKMMPICLPHSNKFKDEDKQGDGSVA